MQKIVHFVLGKANPNRMNGVNKVVNNLCNYQSQLGYDVSVWGITGTPEDVSEIPERNYETYLFPSVNKMFLSAEIEKSIAALEKDTFFHIHGGFIPEFYHLHRLLIKHAIPYMVTPHGCYNEMAMEKNFWVKNYYFKMFERPLLNKAKALHCIGQSELDAGNVLAPNVPKVLIPNGQDLKELEFVYSPMRPETETQPVFGFCGRMDKKMKGLDLLLNGFSLYLKELGGQGLLWMIGGSQDYEEIQELAYKLEIQENVVFFGPQFGQDKLNIIANMDAFYHTSRYEGMPTAILEAAALKVPCVVSKATNISAYIDHHEAGIALAENTPLEIALSMNRINSLKQSCDLSQIGKNARFMVETVFNWENIAQELIEVYAS